ncbi:Anaphase-promoting complex subunit 10 isoform X1 [Oopsacas minuta]|uniref:Anaphase-promoting complex subunit 10 n=1 Tax=Oopsacas minuta TaxID=111878 RepID=A0AAV7JDQ7_9METZ|nr:Anaphase-promoting complex subunit 10 isoform X1 [Oopsacas minuta]
MDQSYVGLNSTFDYLTKEPESIIANREVSMLGVWSVSSCKSGYGVRNLRDNSLETYWQSDGVQPHWVAVEYPKKTNIRKIGIYMDYLQDESYTPSKITILSGYTFLDLKVETELDLYEPKGWRFVELFDEDHNYIRAFILQIKITNNHQSGRDTHLRQVKIYAPIAESNVPKAIGEFTDPNYLKYNYIK